MIDKEREALSEKALLELVNKIEKLSYHMEKMKLAEYVELLGNFKRLLLINFVTGVVRGFGVAIGMTLLAGFIIYLLRQMEVLNLPVIGGIIAEIIRIVQLRLGY